MKSNLKGTELDQQKKIWTAPSMEIQSISATTLGTASPTGDDGLGGGT